MFTNILGKEVTYTKSSFLRRTSVGRAPVILRAEPR